METNPNVFRFNASCKDNAELVKKVADASLEPDALNCSQPLTAFCDFGTMKRLCSAGCQVLGIFTFIPAAQVIEKGRRRDPGERRPSHKRPGRRSLDQRQRCRVVRDQVPVRRRRHVGA